MAILPAYLPKNEENSEESRVKGKNGKHSWCCLSTQTWLPEASTSMVLHILMSTKLKMCKEGHLILFFKMLF